MSAWHYTVYVLPTNGVSRFHGKVPAVIRVPRVPFDASGRIDLERLDDKTNDMPNYWEESPIELTNSLVSQLASWIPETKSWSTEARMFGSSMSDRLSIWHDMNGLVCELKFESQFFAEI